MGQQDLYMQDLTLIRSSQTVVIGCGKTTLPYKTWRVLRALIKAAPEAVSREQLVAEIWDDNFYIGDKAINQALWEIRTALEDDARNPQFIKTIPRKGYQWIGRVPNIVEDMARPSLFKRPMGSFRFPALYALGIVSILFSVQLWLSRGAAAENTSPQKPTKSILAHNGTKALATEHEILVRNVQGYMYVFLASEGKRFGTPVFSANGHKLAFQVQKPEGCKLVTFEFDTQKREEFDSCAAIQGVPV